MKTRINFDQDFVLDLGFLVIITVLFINEIVKYENWGFNSYASIVMHHRGYCLVCMILSSTFKSDI